MRTKPKHDAIVGEPGHRERSAATAEPGPDAPSESESVSAQGTETPLAAQNRILSRLAPGCSIEELMAGVADYVNRVRTVFGHRIHLVDPTTDTSLMGYQKTL